MFKWFREHLGTFSTVLGGVAAAIGFGCMIAFSFVAMSTGAFIALGVIVGGLIVGAVIAGVLYLWKERRNRREREEEQASKEIDIETEVEVEKTLLERSELNFDADISKETIKDSKYVKLEAAVTSLAKRVFILEGNQSTRFQNESLREIHHERRLHAGHVDFDSGSDSDSEETQLLSKHSMFPPKNLRNQQPAANDSLGLGVELRHRNDGRK